MTAAPRPTLLIATDIYGATPELAELAVVLGAQASIVSPYADPRPNFSTEPEAYAAFQARTGITAYAGMVRSALVQSPRPFDLALGFSVGATALWLCLAEAAPWLPRQAALYYGSRIRDHAGLTPQCPARMVFAAIEASFQPAGLVAALRQRGLQALVLPGSPHGFMNPRSPGHDPALAAQETARIKAALFTQTFQK